MIQGNNFVVISKVPTNVYDLADSAFGDPASLIQRIRLTLVEFEESILSSESSTSSPQLRNTPLTASPNAVNRTGHQRISSLGPDSAEPPSLKRMSSLRRNIAPPHIPSSPLLEKYKNYYAEWDSAWTNTVITSTPTRMSKLDPSTLKTRIMQMLTQFQISPTITIDEIQPAFLARQLTLIQLELFRAIHQDDLLNHAPPKTCASIQACAEFFNYLTRVIELSILDPETQPLRAGRICEWIGVASILFKKRNYQTLKCILGALGTPPITRLRKTWAQVPKKEYQTLKEMSDFMSEQDNYSKYREHCTAGGPKPCIPYLGVYMVDVAYLKVAVQKEGGDWKKDYRIREIGEHIRYFQTSVFEDDTLGGAFRKLMGDATVMYSLSTRDQELFIHHWILTRKWVSEKETDELSALREPKRDSLVPAASRDLLKTEFDKAMEYLSANGAPIFDDKLITSIPTPTSGSVDGGTLPTPLLGQLSAAFSTSAKSITNSMAPTMRRKKNPYSVYFEMKDEEPHPGLESNIPISTPENEEIPEQVKKTVMNFMTKVRKNSLANRSHKAL